MITAFQALVLALIQGFTEFLPISSSAHLILPSRVLGWPDQGLAFDVSVHLGTLMAVVLYYRRDLGHMVSGSLRGLRQRRMNPDLKMALLVVLATVPAVVAGFLGKHLVETTLRSVAVIAFTTVFFGVVLWLADARGARTRSLDGLGWRGALTVGLAQVLALVPGTSRSGITMTAALALGYRRDEAARFSFLMSIPVIAGAALLKGHDLLKIHDLAQGHAPVEWDMMGLGVAVSAIAAYITIWLFMRALQRMGMAPFALYRLALGAVLFFCFVAV